MAVTIRPATYDDVDGIQSVAERAWHAAHEPIVGEDVVAQFLDEFYDTASFRGRVDDEDVVLEVAVDGGTVVGYALASPAEDDPGTVHLSHIYVAPDRWGEGIGRRLLARVEDRARDLGGDRLHLAVMADNERAIDFYEAAGYRRTGSFYDDRADTRSYTYESAL